MDELNKKIAKLIKVDAFNIQTKDPPSKVKYKGSKLLPIAMDQQPKIGDFCRSIVVEKDEAKKEIILHLTYLLDGEKSIFLNHLKYKGYIRDYDLKEEFSIFTYIGNFKQISLGTEIIAQIRNIVTKDQKKNYQLTLKYKEKHFEGYFRPGITRDQIEVSSRDWKIYEKYGYFSGIFLAQYEQDFANPGLFHRLSKELRLFEAQSLDVDSLQGSLEALSLDYQRVRQFQQKQWTDKHFMEGLKFLKAHKPDIALEHLNIAKSFDKNSSKIFIARGCALANMNNFNDGLRQIKEALRISPENKQALRYLDEIKKEIRDKDNRQRDNEENERGKKMKVGNTFEPVRRK